MARKSRKNNPSTEEVKFSQTASETITPQQAYEEEVKFSSEMVRNLIPKEHLSYGNNNIYQDKFVSLFTFHDEENPGRSKLLWTYVKNGSSLAERHIIKLSPTTFTRMTTDTGDLNRPAANAVTDNTYVKSIIRQTPEYKEGTIQEWKIEEGHLTRIKAKYSKDTKNGTRFWQITEMHTSTDVERAITAKDILSSLSAEQLMDLAKRKQAEEEVRARKENATSREKFINN